MTPVLEIWPITPPRLLWELSWARRVQEDGNPCCDAKTWDTHTNKHAYSRTICCLFYPTPFVAPTPWWKEQSGGGVIQGKANRVDMLEDSVECPPPVHFLLKQCQPRLTVNLARKATSWWVEQIYGAPMVRLCSVSYRHIGMIYIFERGISRTRKLLMQCTPKEKQGRSAEGRCFLSFSRSVKKPTLRTAVALLSKWCIKGVMGVHWLWWN